MVERFSRRTLVGAAVAGGAALATGSHVALAGALRRLGLAERPTVAWEAAGASELAKLWPASPGAPSIGQIVYPQTSPTQKVVVLSGRLVQLSGGQILSLIATPLRHGGWKFGLVDFQRALHEGWREESVHTASGARSLPSLVRSLAGGSKFVVTQHPVMRVPEG